MSLTHRFPDGFQWGTATSAYQIEGAVDADGRGASIWDTFCRAPGRVLGGDTGDVACDHYHRLEGDLDLMSRLGIQTYRFSVAWPRVIPNGRGPVSEAGLDFYRRLVDGLLERGIAPLVTLYHWDLPQALDDEGGWLSRDTVDAYVDYAALVAEALGDRVPSFTTFNEPWCSAFLGYASGDHAPGHTDAGEAFRVAHHLNLAHARAVSALRCVLPSSAAISLTLNVHQVYPASDDPADRRATEHVDLISNRIFLDPALGHGYPDALVDTTRTITDWSFVEAGDIGALHAPIDGLGINYYTSALIADPASPAGRQAHLAWPGTTKAVSLAPDGELTGIGWRITPGALTDLLRRIAADAPTMPLTIHENGAAYDVAVIDGLVDDTDRIRYLDAHLRALHDAITAGVDVRGYMLWSFLDNFEWAWGYSQRFGIVHVDFDTLARTPKASADWYAGVIAANGL